MKKDSSNIPNGWIFVPGLAFAVVLLFYVGSMSNDWFNPRGRGLLTIALILAVPSIVGLISRICCWQVTRLLAVGTVGSYWVWVGVLTIESFSGIYGLMFFGMALVLVFVVAIVTTGLLGFKMGRGWAFAAVGGMLLGMIATSNSIRRANDSKHWHGANAAGLPEYMVTIDKCAHEFAALHSEAGYPQSLEQLGFHGNGCLPRDLPKNKDFSVVYQPGEKDQMGRVTTYTVRAEELSPHGPDFSSLFTDDSGLVLFSERGPHGNRFPQLDSPLGSDIAFVLNCLRPNGEVFQAVADPEATDRAFQRCARDYLREYIVSRGSLISSWSKMTYRFKLNTAGAVAGFTAEVRPIKYGDPKGGIRSYLLEEEFGDHDTTMRMYGTPEDRPANTSDPLADDCEMRNWRHCEHFADRVK